jgi:hypothetical protein
VASYSVVSFRVTVSVILWGRKVISISLSGEGRSNFRAKAISPLIRSATSSEFLYG